MDDIENGPTHQMVVRIAAQLMVLYDDAASDDRREAAQAYAMALNVLRNETKGVTISFDGPPPILRGIPTIDFPEDLKGRLPQTHRPTEEESE